MKNIMLLISGILMMSLSLIAFSDTFVRGYTKSNGTYVAPHYRSSPDSSYNNNWSVKGNQNPYTGSYGTNSPTYNDKSPSYNNNNYGGNGLVTPSVNSSGINSW